MDKWMRLQGRMLLNWFLNWCISCVSLANSRHCLYPNREKSAGHHWSHLQSKSMGEPTYICSQQHPTQSVIVVSKYWSPNLARLSHQDTEVLLSYEQNSYKYPILLCRTHQWKYKGLFPNVSLVTQKKMLLMNWKYITQCWSGLFTTWCQILWPFCHCGGIYILSLWFRLDVWWL